MNTCYKELFRSARKAASELAEAGDSRIGDMLMELADRIGEEKESLLDYMQQGTKILSDGVTGFSDFAMKQITEVLDYGK